jgi:hypothetical protein
MANYPPDYPHSNELSDHSEPAKKAFKIYGGIPLGTIKDDAGISEFYQDNTQGHADAAKDKTNNRAMKKPEAKTIGSKEFDNAVSATNFAKKFDPKNLSGSIPFALNLVKQIQNNSGPNKILSDIVGSGLNGVISQFTNLLKQNLPAQASALAGLISQGLEIKEKLEELVKNPNVDTQILAETQQQYDEIQQQISQLNSNSSTV